MCGNVNEENNQKRHVVLKNSRVQNQSYLTAKSLTFTCNFLGMSQMPHDNSVPTPTPTLYHIIIIEKCLLCTVLNAVSAFPFCPFHVVNNVTCT